MPFSKKPSPDREDRLLLPQQAASSSAPLRRSRHRPRNRRGIEPYRPHLPGNGDLSFALVLEIPAWMEERAGRAPDSLEARRGPFAPTCGSPITRTTSPPISWAPSSAPCRTFRTFSSSPCMPPNGASGQKPAPASPSTASPSGRAAMPSPTTRTTWKPC